MTPTLMRMTDNSNTAWVRTLRVPSIVECVFDAEPMRCPQYAGAATRQKVGLLDPRVKLRARQWRRQNFG